ncbi:MAG: family 20 glycosylhydrolase [Verrucomicrobiia bacterium]|jgi:thiol-disulfide isomerase/thioredoxin
MKINKLFSFAAFLFTLFYLTASEAEPHFYKAVHLMAPYPAKDLSVVEQAIKTVLAPSGVNMIIFEIDYRFQWRSHPELRGDQPFSEEQIKNLALLCQKHKIKLVPLFNCLGHQSWKSYNSPLIEKYPQFDETPNLPKNNPDIYCRSWCPSNPDLLPVIAELFTELIKAFNTDMLHIGMDEVFIIADKDCPRCKGKDPAELFAKAVNDLHDILSKKLKVKMMMWGDRLLDDSVMKYGKWEASRNGTHPAVDKIPKDIIICDWHYEARNSYPSVDFFLSKGFKTMPSSWKNQKAALAFLNYAKQFRSNPNLVGHLCTTWANSANLARSLLGENAQSDEVKEIATTTKILLKEISKD